MIGSETKWGRRTGLSYAARAERNVDDTNLPYRASEEDKWSLFATAGRLSYTLDLARNAFFCSLFFTVVFERYFILERLQMET